MDRVVGKEEALVVVGDNGRILELESSVVGESGVKRELQIRGDWKLLSSFKEALGSRELDTSEERGGNLHKAPVIFQMEERSSVSKSTSFLVVLASSVRNIGAAFRDSGEEIEVREVGVDYEETEAFLSSSGEAVRRERLRGWLLFGECLHD